MQAAAKEATEAAGRQPLLASVSRRDVLRSHAAALLIGATGVSQAGHALQPAPARAEDGDVASELLSRLLADGDIYQPGNSIFSKAGNVFYPRWMFGEWNVTARFASFRAPLGAEFVDPALLAAARAPPQEGGPGSTVGFVLRFFSTLPDTWENNFRVFTGAGMPIDAIVGDRAFNAKSVADAYLGYPAVASVRYDPLGAPDRETLEFSTAGPGGAVLPPRRAEVYINNTRSESPAVNEFVTSELFRQVSVAVRSVDVTDYEVMTHYALQGPDGSRVAGRQRTAIYLDPRAPRYFEARGRAVAVYDYEWDMARATPETDAPFGAVACVQTPKDVIQCV